MAIANQGLGEKWIGKIGGVVFQRNKNQVIVKSYQPNVRNPQTEKQTEQRSKISYLTEMYRSLSGLLVTSFKEYTTSMSCFNVFTSENISKIDGQVGTSEASVNLGNAKTFKMSKGTLRMPAITERTVNVNKLEVWITETEITNNENAKADDLLQVIVIDWNWSQKMLMPDVMTRTQAISGGLITITPPNQKFMDSINDKTALVYTYWQSADRKKNSDTAVG